jgi:hypothetical protein
MIMDAATTVGVAMVLIGFWGVMTSSDDAAIWVLISGAATIYFFGA